MDWSFLASNPPGLLANPVKSHTSSTSFVFPTLDCSSIKPSKVEDFYGLAGNPAFDFLNNPEEDLL